MEGEVICSRCRNKIWASVTEFIFRRWHIPRDQITRITPLTDPSPAPNDVGDLITYCLSSITIKGFDSLDVVELIMEMEDDPNGPFAGVTEADMTTAGAAYDLVIRVARRIRAMLG